MKSLSLIITFMLAGLCLNAQNDSMRYIFSDKDYKISGFGGPIVQFSTFDGEFAVFNGGGGAVIFNNQFFIGGVGMGMSTEHNFPDIYSSAGNLREKKLQVGFGYGGIWLGYIFMPNNPVHFGISSQFGGGAITLYDSEFEHENYDYHTDVIGVIAPQAEVEMNLTRWFKINFGVGYRFVTGISNATYYTDANQNTQRYFNDSDFNAPYGSVTFLFGGFGPKDK